jgi:hypothetical protein
VESTVALTEETFKLGAELMVMSIVQGGPAPNFMSPVIYDIISRGFKGQTCLLLDMIENGNFRAIANKVIYSPVYTTLNFWYDTDKIGTRTTFLVLGLPI